MALWNSRYGAVASDMCWPAIALAAKGGAAFPQLFLM
jgi:hypothetical protein